MRALRRRYSRVLADESPATVLRFVRSLLDGAGWAERVISFEVLAAHERAFRRLNDRLVETMAHGLLDWGSVDLFGVTVVGQAWRPRRLRRCPANTARLPRARRRFGRDDRQGDVVVTSGAGQTGSESRPGVSGEGTRSTPISSQARGIEQADDGREGALTKMTNRGDGGFLGCSRFGRFLLARPGRWG